MGFVNGPLVVIHSPQQATNQLAEQERWLRAELEHARQNRARHILIFVHHPWFLKAAGEPDEYFNIPRARRAACLGLFHDSGVKQLFSGHHHCNAVARDGDLEAVTSGPVGKPPGEGKSGLACPLFLSACPHRLVVASCRRTDRGMP